MRQNPSRRFIFVEVAFFMRWWAEQDDVTRDATRALFASGQLVRFVQQLIVFALL